MNIDLEKQFHQEMLRIYDEATRLKYRPTRFLQMVEEHGGRDAAKRLLAGDTLSSGFVRLFELGRPDLTVKSLVLKEPWSRLFTGEELNEAERRLA